MRQPPTFSPRPACGLLVSSGCSLGLEALLLRPPSAPWAPAEAGPPSRLHPCRCLERPLWFIVCLGYSVVSPGRAGPSVSFSPEPPEPNTVPGAHETPHEYLLQE